MARLSRVLRSAQGGALLFRCPGCDAVHRVWVGTGPGPRWVYNGNPEKPTFGPSILVKGEYWEPPVTSENAEEWKRNPWPQHKVTRICHSFVRDGQIQFLGDCTHGLAGKTVPLPDFDGEDAP